MVPDQIIVSLIYLLSGVVPEVDRNMVYANEEKELPRLAVFMGDDEPDLETRTLRSTDHDLSVEIHVFVAKDEQEGIETKLAWFRDQIFELLQPEGVLEVDEVISVDEMVAEKPDMMEGAGNVGRQVLNYNVRYRRHRSA